MFTCIFYLYIYLYVYLHVYLHVHLHAYLYVYLHDYLHVYLHVYLHFCLQQSFRYVGSSQSSIREFMRTVTRSSRGRKLSGYIILNLCTTGIVIVL